MNRSAKVMIARFPGDNSEHPASSQWVIETNLECLKDERVSEVLNWYKSDTPITIVRNECVLNALAAGVDLLVMIDSDMKPDHQAPKIPSASKFWKSSFDHWYENYHKGPSIIAAPYVGPAPSENPYIFQWKTHESGHPDPDFQLQMFTREQAAERAGFEEVPALPTGLIMIDMRVFTGFIHDGQTVKLPPPWFYYEYRDEFESAKASTEDVTFTRDSHLLGVRVLVNWDAWAIHIKLKECCKPQLLTPNMVGNSYKKALGALPSDESMVILGDSPAPRPKQLVNPKEPPATTMLALPDQPVQALRSGRNETQRLDVKWFDGSPEWMPKSVVVPAGGTGVVIACEVLQGTSYPLIAPAEDVHLVVDVGANAGMSTLWFMANYPTADVVAFEPDPAMYALLKKNVPKDDRHIALRPLALWNKDEERTFYQHPTNSAENSLIQGPFGGTPIRVDCIDAAKALDGMNVDILKVDTEGAELTILKRIIPLHPEIKVIYVEAHSPADCEAIQSLLKKGWDLHCTRGIGRDVSELAFTRKEAAVSVKHVPSPPKKTRRVKLKLRKRA